MSVGPLGGIAGSVAGSPLAQTQGSEPERASQDSASLQRRILSNEKADAAAGVGETDGEDHESDERDADGRRLWENPPEGGEADTQAEDAGAEPQRLSKDTTGQSGNLLDLSG
ncbi:MAG: hypothetical protein JXB62_13965 [Pirellulales bacterium]|nr:hypothetical protein [Pirellulales bacterium]